MVEPANDMSVSVPSDKELLGLVARGDQQALGKLYQRHHRLVYAIISRSLRGLSDTDIEDLRQDVFVTLFQQAGRYVEQGGADKVRPYICGIAIRKAREFRRNRNRRKGLIERWLGSKEEAAADAPEHRGDIAQAFATLPDYQREILLLSVLEDLSTEDIGVALSISPKTVATRLHRARANLAQELGRAKSTKGSAS